MVPHQVQSLLPPHSLLASFSSLLNQVVYYTFAMVGMELFKGKVQYFGEGSEEPTRFFCGNLLLKGTSFAQLNYCKNNFNDVVSSFILLVELTVVNQWHDILHLLQVLLRVLPTSRGQPGLLLLEEDLLGLSWRLVDDSALGAGLAPGLFVLIWFHCSVAASPLSLTCPPGSSSSSSTLSLSSS